MTLEEINNDIVEGRSTKIYYSSMTLWWTHLESDVNEASKQGRAYKDAIQKKYLSDPNVSETDKSKMRALFLKTKSALLPLDPTGAPLYVMDNPVQWILKSQENSKHFGKHGIKAFVLTHHQNCKDFFSNKWEKYNNYLDGKIHTETLLS